jgi:predicted nucleotidyltransferase
MCNRYADWFRQAEADLRHARHSIEKGDFDLNSVVIKSIDPDQIREAVTSFAEHIRRQHSEVERVLWFGSWVTGLPTPASDVDHCLILSSSDKPPRERIPDYLPLGFPTGIDRFAYTKDEFERLRHSSPGWHKAITSGQEI